MKAVIERTEQSTYNVAPSALEAFKRSASVRRTIADTLYAAVELGAMIDQEHDDNCRIFGGRNELPIGEPRQLIYWPDADGTIQCQTFLATRQKLAQLAAKFGIDENSALNWCIDCLNRVDEAYDDREKIYLVSKYGRAELKIKGRSRRRRRWNVD